MTKKDISSIRGIIDSLEEEQELLRIEGEVDPIYEIAGIEKALEGSVALLFENIKGYPGVRSLGNLFSSEERAARLFDAADYKQLKVKCLEAMRNPIPPRIVEQAPCQEVAITRDIDVPATLPIIKHSERDCGHILGGGNALLSGKYFGNGNELSFKRMHFRGKDWSSIAAGVGSHLGDAIHQFREQKIPLTINISAPPAAMVVAGSSFLHSIVPIGADELGFAGALQGFPIDICKAKTVDAYAIANSEWVIEGYVEPAQRVWESEEAEKLGQWGVAPLFPEWTGVLGRAYKFPKFQATAITHVRDKPIFSTPLARSFENDIVYGMFWQACFWELAERLIPGFVTDVNALKGVLGGTGLIIFQVKKTRKAQDGWPRNLLAAALGVGQGVRMAIVVNEDVDIYSADDVLWAILTRVNPSRDIVQGIGGGMGHMLMPTERAGVGGIPRYEGGLGIDATTPFGEEWHFERAHYPVDRVDLRKWLSEEQIAKAKAKQSDYARILAETGR